MPWGRSLIALALMLQAITIPPGSVAQYGLGTKTCDVAMAAPEAVRASWVLGFWTGLNAAFGRSVGQTTAPQAIVAEIERRCPQVPKRTLAEVTLATYSQAAGRGR